MENANTRRLWRDSYGRFQGERRIDCESVPRLPASSVRFAIEDPRSIPAFLFVWRNQWDRTVAFATVTAETRDGKTVEVTYEGPGSPVRLGTVRRALPNGGNDFFLVCWSCDWPRRFLYAFERIESSLFWGWMCRTCSRLRYVSEGNGRNGGGPYPRFPIDPWVFSSPKQASEALGDFWHGRAI